LTGAFGVRCSVLCQAPSFGDQCALLDAVGHAVDAAGARFTAMPERERPGKVLFVVVTDGHENASHEYSAERIKAMLKEQQEVYSWEFTYLGAHQDAWTIGSAEDAQKEAGAKPP
jgi:hypothetical protein